MASSAATSSDQITPSELGGLVCEFHGRVPVLPCLYLGILAGVLSGIKVPWLGVIVGISAAGGVLLLFRYLAGQLCVRVHSAGLIYRNRAKNEVWKWDDVEEFLILPEKREIRTAPPSMLHWLFEKVLESVIRALLPRAAKYKISYELRRPGHKLVLGPSVRDYKKLGELVGNFVMDKRLPLLLSAFRAGHTIPFGPLLLGQDGLTDTGSKQPRVLPWDELADVRVSNYAMVVRQVGKKNAWKSVRINSVPNAAILAALTAHVTVEKTSS